jgi:hypothetical protein
MNLMTGFGEVLGLASGLHVELGLVHLGGR